MTKISIVKIKLFVKRKSIGEKVKHLGKILYRWKRYAYEEGISIERIP
ncbi:MAG: hypothetical protein N4A62_01030 [Marinisporobacter sp.]|jgi:hypothetical protein|nr:hypothetical protein [Marinisporobacter sp.]